MFLKTKRPLFIWGGWVGGGVFVCGGFFASIQYVQCRKLKGSPLVHVCQRVLELFRCLHILQSQNGFLFHFHVLQ